MNISFKGAVVGALALAGAALSTAEVQAMPVGPVAAAAADGAHLDQVYYYGYRRRFFYGYRPFFGYRRFGYGYRRPFFGYGYRRPFYGYGYRRFY